jgi:hypothetical protein
LPKLLPSFGFQLRQHVGQFAPDLAENVRQVEATQLLDIRHSCVKLYHKPCQPRAGNPPWPKSYMRSIYTQPRRLDGYAPGTAVLFRAWPYKIFKIAKIYAARILPILHTQRIYGLTNSWSRTQPVHAITWRQKGNPINL